MGNNKTINVVAAIIVKDNLVFATQRGYGEYQGGWEFPGGKIEPNETPEDALIREINEELNSKIIPERLVTTVEYDYPNFHLSMRCYLSRLAEGHLQLLEHSAARWLSLETLDDVEWLPADLTVVESIKRQNILS